MYRLIPVLFLLSITASAGTDYQCLSDCTGRYSWAYCKKFCDIPDEQPSRPANPAGAFIEGRRAAQEAEARQIELERLRAEQARREAEAANKAENDEVWSMVAKDFTATFQKMQAEEIARLKAENEALKKQLEELKTQKDQ